MVTFERFLAAAVGTTLVAALAHAAFEYPERLSAPRDARRELLEVGGLFALVAGVVTYATLAFRGVVTFDPVLLVVGPWHVDGVVVASALAHVAVPLALEWHVHDRSLADLGIRLPTNWLPALVLIAFGFGVGLSAVLQGRTPTPSPAVLLAALYTPVVEEELFYRGIVQSKLERAAGQRVAWLGSGVLFGVSHVPIDFFGLYWVEGGGDFPLAAARLLSQIGFGLLYGVLYAQCRSLLAPVLAHYCTDELGGVAELVG